MDAQSASYECSNKGDMALVSDDVDAKDDRGRTPLHRACENGHTATALALIDRGADIYADDFDERTPLHRACGVSLI